MRWGLPPFFWKKSLKELPATFNARAETVAEKPMFRDFARGARAGLRPVEMIGLTYFSS